MAVQFAPQSNRKSFAASLGEALGTGLGGLGTGYGTGLGQGLQAVAQHKLTQLQQRSASALKAEELRNATSRTAQALQSLGYDPEQSLALAGLPAGTLQEVIKAKQKEPQQRAFAEALNSILGGSSSSAAENAGNEGGSQGVGIGALSGLGGLNENQALKLADLAIKRRQEGVKEGVQKRKEEAQGRKENFQREQFTEKQKLEAYRFTKPVTTEIIKGAKSAQDSQKRLDRMETLNKKGNLNNPVYLEVLKKANIDIPALKNADSQEFEKLSLDFLKNAKDVFGSRVTNFDAQQFLKTVPTLSQTSEGRERVIRNLRLMNEAALERDKARKEVVKENGGKPPFDLEEKIEDKAEPRLNAIAKEFKNGIESENRKTPAVGQTFNELPAAKDYPTNTIITDEDTGKKYKNDGVRWVEA